LSPQSQAASARNIEAFRKGLRDLGYVEGRSSCQADNPLPPSKEARGSPSPFYLPGGLYALRT
jgi:hypothetical protein